jgi:hypothetical protein
MPSNGSGAVPSSPRAPAPDGHSPDPAHTVEPGSKTGSPPSHGSDSIPQVLGLGHQVSVRGFAVPVWACVIALVLLLTAPLAGSRFANRHR